ncbi:MAG: metallophosphoesterase [Kiritimatiellales bacterium]
MNRRAFINNSLWTVAALSGSRAWSSVAQLTGNKDSWSLILLPDTQYYSQEFPEVFLSQTRWIAEKRDELNIQYVLQLGDITNMNSEPEWENARNCFAVLDDAKIPYAFVTGNHDYRPVATRETKLNEYLPYKKYAAWPTFGGALKTGDMQNTYHLFEAGGEKWLLLALEWGPRNEVVKWGNKIVAANSDRNVIVFTHAYLYSDSTRYNWAEKGKDQTWNPHSYPMPESNDGEELWQKLVKKHPNVKMTFNGHVLNNGTGFLESTGDAGNKVCQMLINFQGGVRPLPRDGTAPERQTIRDDGSLRILQFTPGSKTVKVTDYSPYRNYYAVGEAHQFRFDLG